MKKCVHLLIALFLCSCTTDELTRDSRPDDNDEPITKAMYSVSVTGKDNKLTISCTGVSVFLREIHVTGLTPAFSDSREFPSNQRSVTVGVPGYGAYSIRVSYVNTSENVLEHWNAVFYYQSERAEDNRTEENVTECRHDFSHINREMWWDRNGQTITFDITVTFGNYKAVLYPVYTPDNQPEKYIQTCLLDREISMQSLIFNDAQVAYELRIYSADCLLPFDKCSDYLSYKLTKTFTSGKEPGSFH